MAENADSRVRTTAVVLIGLVGDSTDASTHRGRPRGSVGGRTGAAASTLGRIGSARPNWPALLLDDRIPFVRAEAAASLGVIGSTEAVPRLLEIAQTDRFRPARAWRRRSHGWRPPQLTAAAAAPDAARTCARRPICSPYERVRDILRSFRGGVRLFRRPPSPGDITLVAWHSLAAIVGPAPTKRSTRRTVALHASVSIILPAFNEEAEIVASVHSLLDLRYPSHEVIVVSDGSTDGTLERLQEAFDLVPVRQALRTRIAAAPIRAAFVSRTHPNLCVLDKENGGKADALNAGINAAAHAYFCAIDADAILEQDSLLRIVEPFVDDPELVRGRRHRESCQRQRDRRREADRLPAAPEPLARFQVLEYFRAFLIGRLAFDSINGVLIISGAFGLFNARSWRRSEGTPDTVGEDAELVVGSTATCGPRKRNTGSVRLDPVCWTEAPEDVTTLGRQRRRWQRGLGRRSGGTGGGSRTREPEHSRW